MNSNFNPGKYRPELIPDHLWQLDYVTPDGMRASYLYTDPSTGVTFRKTENLVEESHLKMCQHLFNESEGKRWGDGQIVGMVPMNIVFQHFTPDREGDRDFTKWFLNHEEIRPYRTFKGRI